ncbi:MAG: DUF2845 domain-containing protein [Gammaproteobacteria bacterium]
MNTRLSLAFVAALGGLVAMMARADDSMNCGNALITIGMVGSQVTAKCGQPKDKNVTEVPQRTRRANGSSAITGTLHVEQWTYDRGYGQFPALLTFEEGKLKSIELLTKR